MKDKTKLLRGKRGAFIGGVLGGVVTYPLGGAGLAIAGTAIGIPPIAVGATGVAIGVLAGFGAAKAIGRAKKLRGWSPPRNDSQV